jgi:hypothetical protein
VLDTELRSEAVKSLPEGLAEPLNRFGYDAMRCVGLPDWAKTGDQVKETVMALLPTWFEDYNEVYRSQA